jgi:hypothetical protein
MENDDKLPRGHAYIRMRNGGYKINIDYPEVESSEAERIIEAVMAIVRGAFTTPPVAEALAKGTKT